MKRGQLSQALPMGTGQADPTWTHWLRAPEAPANTAQKIQCWFCCSSCSQPVKDNRKRWSR